MLRVVIAAMLESKPALAESSNSYLSAPATPCHANTGSEVTEAPFDGPSGVGVARTAPAGPIDTSPSATTSAAPKRTVRRLLSMRREIRSIWR